MDSFALINNNRDKKESVSVNQFQVKDVRWKVNLDGQTMEMRLVEYFLGKLGIG